MGGLISYGRAWQWEPDPPTCSTPHLPTALSVCPDPLIFTGTEITDRALDPAHPQP